MARGFESKDVEYQQAESQRSKTARRALSLDERKDLERRRTLELELACAEADLRATSSPLRRRMLEEAIAALRGRLET